MRILPLCFVALVSLSVHVAIARRHEEISAQFLDSTSRGNDIRERLTALPSCHDKAAIEEPAQGPVKCRGGIGPTTHGYNQWDVGDACHDYYREVNCLDRFPGKNGPRAIGGGSCKFPILKMEDCGKLAESIEGKDLKHIEVLLTDLIRRAPEEWMWVPSSRHAVLLLAEYLEKTLVDHYSDEELDPDAVWNSRVAHVGEKLAEVWNILTLYCGGTEERALEVLHRRYQTPHWDAKREAIDTAKKECKKDTDLDIYAHYHPAVRAAQKDFQGVPQTLSAMRALGVFAVDKDAWKRLCAFSNIRKADRLYSQVVERMQSLIRSAGDRGAAELSMALGLARHGLFGAVQPVGGERRLEELNVKEYLESALKFPESIDKLKVERSLAKLAELREESALEWVNENDISHIVESVTDLIGAGISDEECISKSLEPGCSRQQINCIAAGLQSDCSKTDLENAAELRETCSYLGLASNCTLSDIKDYEDLKRACVTAGLPLDCSRQDVADEQRRVERCSSLGLDIASCSLDDVEFAEALQQRCRDAGLPLDCSQEELDAVTTTTSTTTTGKVDHVCSLTERTGMRFGVSFSLAIERGCSKVMCSYFRTRAEFMDRFFSASFDDKEHICNCNSDYDASFTFRTYRQKECAAMRCWDNYAKDLSTQVAGKKRLLPEMRLTNPKHWEAECVPEAEATTNLPSLTDRGASLVAMQTSAIVAAALVGAHNVSTAQR